MKIEKTEQAWREELTLEQFEVLREEGTERRFTSPLNEETRKGNFACAACGQPLYKANQKIDSKTGWPRFYDAVPGWAPHADVPEALRIVAREFSGRPVERRGRDRAQGRSGNRLAQSADCL